MTLIGYNIDGDELAGNQSIISQVQRTGSNWNFVINHKGVARDVAPFSKIGTIFRAFDPFAEHGARGDFDNDFWTRHDARKVADWMKVNLDDISDMYLTAGNNEPSSNPSNRPQLVKWLSGLAKYLHANEQHGAIGEIAVAKTLERDEIQAGVWDELIETMHALGDWHIWTFHEYTTGVAPASYLPDYPRNLLNKAIANPKNWLAKMPDGYDGGYHIGRWHWLRQRAIDIGKPMKRVVITECIFDYMEDANDNGKWLKEVLRPMFNYNGFEGLKGWEGHKPYWKWLLGTNDDIAWQNFMFEQTANIARAYPPEVEGIELFGLNPDWYHDEGVDLSRSGVAHYRHRIETKPVTRDALPPPIPPEELPQIEYEPLTIRAKDNTRVRIRNTPSQEGDIIGYLYDIPMSGYVSLASSYADNYEWKHIEIDVSGYVAWEFVSIVTSTPPDDSDIEITLAAIKLHAETASVAIEKASEAYGAILAILDDNE